MMQPDAFCVAIHQTSGIWIHVIAVISSGLAYLATIILIATCGWWLAAWSGQYGRRPRWHVFRRMFLAVVLLWMMKDGIGFFAACHS